MKSKVWRPLKWPKKNLYLVRQATFSSSQICKEVQKPYSGKGPGWLSFFGSMPKIFILNYIVFIFIITILFLGVEVAPAYHEVIKKLKMNHLWLYTLHDISHSMPQRLQNEACRLLQSWIHVPEREINIFWKFRVKIKFWSKISAYEIR